MTSHNGGADGKTWPREEKSVADVTPASGRRREATPRSAYPTGNAARRALLTLRQEGMRSFWFKLLSRCGYRRLLLLERVLDQPVPEFTPALAVEVAMLTESEIDDYLVFRPETMRGDAIDRLRSGQLCFVARHAGRIVGGTWITVQPLWLAFLESAIDMGPADAHAYDKFILPAYRGHGISNALRMHHLRHLQGIGYRRVIVAALPENASSLRDIRKGGFRPYGNIRRLKIGPWQRIFRTRSRADGF